MKKTYIWVLFLFLVSCSINENIENKQQETNNNSLSINTHETEKVTEAGSHEEFFVLVTAKVLNVRTSPNVDNDNNKISQAYMGETYTVFEQTMDDKYTWYKIGDNEWIANDGNWCIEYGNKNISDYPYVLNEEQTKVFLHTVHTGGHCFSGYKDGVYFGFINIFEKPQDMFDCNVLFGTTCSGNSLAGVYHYNVGSIVKIDDKTFDVYISPVKNDGYEDYSTGCLRFSDIGSFIADGNPEDLRLCFDITFIQNKNDVADDCLKDIYNVKIHYAPAQFMW